ncbi:MAG: glycosyltransferase family 2 protein [Actinomyces urogenitalis]|uniref:glycosyltransferase family 2 protein n=1 Tax=Actinomyces urogenitalis TaxID=103621 RepID=UPI00050E4E7F|nr:glycosyltransferase family 2 protein [Actinomyces urogenitalis]KGF01256.1 glycosyl transferase [Actinomyces urogenitalis S6-C4]MDU5875334.1 glycosyltransferase family 2 protein [Actinomyces urogenitalis]
MTGKKISVVVPSYNEEKSVQAMRDRVAAVFSEKLSGYEWELIFVDDYSTDGTRTEIRRLAAQDRRVKGVFNARNFGFHRNVFSSLMYGSGDATFMLFGDLQDPPENLPEFVARWEAGSKVVIGQRRSSDEGWIMTACRHAYYKLIDWFADTPQIARFTGYGLYDRSFIDVLKQVGDIQPFLKAVVAEYGIDLEIVQYDQAQSSRGKSNFSFLKNYDFAMQGITSSTKLLMRMATFIAALVGVVCLGIAVVVVIQKLVDWNSYPVGEAARSVGLFFLGSIQLFFIGILGEYILNINGRIVRKPRVVIGERVGFEPVQEDDGTQALTTEA